MKLSRVMFAAPKSGSGKTTITCAFLQAMKNRGESVASYKCGPDYIDPMFHSKVIGVPSKNLDTFFSDEDTVMELLTAERTDTDLAVLEGVMGMYDGLGGIREEGSSYHLAKVTRTPIVLVVDAKGMGKSVIPLIAGFLAYDTEHLIKGVLFNRMSKGYYDIIAPLVREELSVQVVGFLPEQKMFQMQSRHLGLVLPGELPNLKKQLAELTETVEKTVSIDEILEIAKTAKPVNWPGVFEGMIDQEYEENAGEKVKIAVAYDEAFCFYYRDNVSLLEKYGAEIVYFSPIHDKQLPIDCDGLLLGGGYPENYAKQLSENKGMLESIKMAVNQGLPTVAECGGFMYLQESLCDENGDNYPMTGVLPGRCCYTGKLVRFGYIELKESEKCENAWGLQNPIKGHEFHYFDSDKNGESCIAQKPTSQKSYPCVVTEKALFAGFPHLYYPSNPSFAKCFVKKAQFFHQSTKTL